MSVDGEPSMTRNILFVASGGAFGSVARYLIAVVAEKVAPEGMPLGTFTVNLLGSALLGAILAGAAGASPRISPELRLLLGTGVMGGFTTYSTFNAEVLRALQTGAPGRAVLYLAATVLFCLLGAWAGWTLVTATGSPS
jgi:CrcB protein